MVFINEFFYPAAGSVNTNNFNILFSSFFIARGM